MNNYLSLPLTSILILVFWLGETLLRDWRGLEWLNYFHYSLLIIPCIFIAWLILTDKYFKASKHLLKYPILVIGYFLICLVILAMLLHHSDRYNQYILFKPLAIFLFMIVTFGVNLVISKLENRKLSLKQKVILFFACLFIPICSELFTSLIFTQTWLFPPDINLSGILYHWFKSDGLIGFYLNESILHWLKSGGLILSISLYEGIFILYVKKQYPEDQIHSVIKITV